MRVVVRNGRKPLREKMLRPEAVTQPGRSTLRFRERPFDMVIVGFFCVNLFFVTYFVDIEQLTIADPYHFSYPLWPPHFFVNLVHSYGSRYDPLLMARPPFWKMLIWIDAVVFGPFYAVAIYALVRGREWIRVPAVFWAGMMTTDVLVILAQERYGVYRTPDFPMVLALNLPWLILPIVVGARMTLRSHPFSQAVVASEADTPERERV